MTPEELIARLESLGILLATDGGRLRVNAPRGGLTEELKSAISGSRDALISLLDGRTLQSAPIERIKRGPVLPVSSFQERMWILQRMDPNTVDYNIVSVWKSAAQFSAERQMAALRALIARHEILHGAFDEFDDTLGMRILPPEATPIELRELGGDLLQHRDPLSDIAHREVRRPFDLTGAPALRFIVCRFGERGAVTLCAAHHIAVDAWSLTILEKEFALLCSQQDAPHLPSLELQYADYAAWQRSVHRSGASADLLWWKGYLSNAPQLSVFPPDRSGATTPSGATRTFEWSADLASRLRVLVRAEGATVYTALLAACAVVLRWHTGQQDFVLGSPMGVRERVDLETMIGPFIALLMIRIDVSGDPSFSDLMRRTRDSMLAAHAHRHVPFETLVDHLKPPRVLNHSPLFQIAVVQHNAPGGEDAFNVSGGSMHELTWFLREAAGAFHCDLEFRSDLYSDTAIERIAAHLEQVLTRAADNPTARVSELMRLDGAERRHVTEVLNHTAFPVPDDSFVAHFERRAAAAPDRIAIVHEGTRLTYSELNRRANKLAHFLDSLGVGRGQRVALCLERSPQLVVALLAVQKTGAAYVPLDPAFPAERLSFMLSDCGATVLLTTGSVPPGLQLPATVTVVDCEHTAALAQSSDGNPSLTVGAADPVYVIYTSGSTGRPKGVVIPHGSLMNFLWSMTHEPGLAETDVLAAVTTISFDIAGLELYLPLLVGARIELISREMAANGALLAARLNECGVTVMQATPATWRLLVAADCRLGASFRALCGGESLPRDLADDLLDRVGELWNLYGPTETTIWSTKERIGRDDQPITIGQPIGNTQVYILGDADELLPIGAQGEICIGGAGVALGYHDRPHLTAERFVPDPFASGPGARLYRTGDLGRRREDGRIEHLGRIDQQIKIRGFRVEPGEIEARLLDHPAIRQAVVIAREAARGDVRLVAYVVYATAQDLTVSEVRKHLRRELPDYMIPSLVVALASLPLTPNGKLSRAGLPDPFVRTTAAAVEHASLVTPTEKLLGEFWRDLLKVERIGAEDNFFDLGGHSLLTLRFAAAIEKRTGWRMDPRTLYFQNLRQIAATVVDRAAHGNPG